ncbi:protein translocase subunit SecD [Helicobacter sp. 10-6591]|uniref:protein translocase subunit SecD n=1 Tax=Helicobacter sp. 10-6591 TaxID=2004998 RepID=UPI000DCD141E|nr:protein translocase subunit SecD [Helicobacter sp. 10-6591]RAX52766.1 protein translocase subunit SecD [Helicobacter sp. 10-6591]
MKQGITYRLWLLFIAAILGITLALPSVFQTESGPKITLGLDLQGGLNLLLGVRVEEALQARISSLASSINYEAHHKKLLVDSVKIAQNSVYFELFDPQQSNEVKKMLAKFNNIVITQQDNVYSLSFTPEEIIQIQEDAINQAINTIRNRLNIFGLSETSVTRQGRQNILVEVPGKNTPEEEERLRNLISKPAHLQFMAVDEERNGRVAFMSDDEANSYNDIILPFAQSEQEKAMGIPEKKLLLKKIPVLDGASVTNAMPTKDQNNRYVVSFNLDSDGARKFGNFTGANIGNHLAIVLDNKVYSAPTIQARLTDSGQITGDFDRHSAADLAVILKSGALPASMEILEKRSVGPSLGEDSIQASMVALLSGFLLVLAFMVFYYNFAGVIAVCALLINITLIIAVMALFKATLTLPGMAGIVLTVGMAVDANIIINERIREFLRAGNSIAKSIELGYANASRAIFDSNATTLLVAILLYANGTGAIKGFAITMSLGIIASVLTAIIGTQGIYQALLPKMGKTRRLRFWFGLNPQTLESSSKITAYKGTK